MRALKVGLGILGLVVACCGLLTVGVGAMRVQTSRAPALSTTLAQLESGDVPALSYARLEGPAHHLYGGYAVAIFSSQGRDVTPDTFLDVLYYPVVEQVPDAPRGRLKKLTLLVATSRYRQARDVPAEPASGQPISGYLSRQPVPLQVKAELTDYLASQPDQVWILSEGPPVSARESWSVVAAGWVLVVGGALIVVKTRR